MNDLIAFVKDIGVPAAIALFLAYQISKGFNLLLLELTKTFISLRNYIEQSIEQGQKFDNSLLEESLSLRNRLDIIQEKMNYLERKVTDILRYLDLNKKYDDP